MIPTDSETLLQQWKEGEARQKLLWQEILKRGLFFESQGIDPGKRSNSWRNPPSATAEAERLFFKHCQGRRVSGNSTRTSKLAASIDMAAFD